MSETIDERVVQMRFDNQDFEQNIRQSQQSLENFNKTLNMQKNMNDPLQNISVNVEKLTDRFSILGEVIHNRVYRVVDNLIGSVERLVKSISIDQVSEGMSKYSKKTVAVATIKSALPDESIDVIYEQLEKLNKYTDETSYDFTAMVENIGKFTSAGIGLTEAEQAMEGIANAVAKAGGNASTANRVMYNFSQSMGMGYVGLMDWMSIENANVATKDFKQTIIDTAVELGVLKKTGDKVTTTKGTEIDYKNFRSTLSQQWLTKDVLTATLKKYAESEEAFAMAQNARTFEDAMNAIKDAVSTGWMTTFENIFGNVDEATELWTKFCTAITVAIEPVAELRNGILEFWKENGGRQAMLEGITSAATGLWGIVIAITDAIKDLIPGLEHTDDTFGFFGEKLVGWSENVKSFGEYVKTALGYTKKTIVLQHEADGLQYSKLFQNGNDLFKTITGADDENTDNRLKKLKDRIIDYVDTLDTLKTMEDSLKKGSKGEYVKTLQEQLSKLGYLDLLGEPGIDGIFGPLTESALKKFQEDLGLSATGTFDPKDYDKYFGNFDTHVEEITEDTYTFGTVLSDVRTIALSVWSVLKLSFKIFGDAAKLVFGSAGNVTSFLGRIISTLSWIADIMASITNWIYDKDIFGWLYKRFGWLANMILSSKLISLMTSKVPALGWLSTLNMIVSTVTWLMNNVPGFLSNTKAKISNAFQIAPNIFKFIKDMESATTQELMDDRYREKYGEQYDSLLKIYNIYERLKYIGGKAFDVIDNAATGAKNGVVSLVSGMMALPNFIRDMEGATTQELMDDRYREKYGEQYDSLLKIYNIYEKIKTVATTAIDWIKSKWEVLSAKFTNWAPIQWLVNQFNVAKTAVENFLNRFGILDDIKNSFDAITKSVQTAINKVKEFFGIGKTNEELEAEQLDHELKSVSFNPASGGKNGAPTDGSFVTVDAKNKDARSAMTYEERQKQGITDWMKGDSGEDIERIQTLLTEAGYGDIVGDIDGVFGKKTLAALQQYYTDHPDAEEIVSDEWPTLWETIGKTLEDIWSAIETFVKPIWEKVEGALQWFWDKFSGGSSLSEKMVPVKKVPGKKSFQSATAADSEADEVVPFTIGNFFTVVGERLTAIYNTISDFVKPIWEKISGFIKPIWEKIKSWFTSDEGDDTNIFEKIVTGLKNWLGLDKMNPNDISILTVMQSVLDKIIGGITGLFDVIGGAGGKLARSGMQNAWHIIWPLLAILGFITVIPSIMDIIHDVALIKNKNASDEEGPGLLADFGNLILKLGIAFAAIAVSIKLLSTVSPSYIIGGAALLIVLMAAIIGFVAAKNALDKKFEREAKDDKGDGSESVVKLISSMVASIAQIMGTVVAISLLSDSKWNAGYKRLWGLVAIIAAIGLLAVGMSIANKKWGVMDQLDKNGNFSEKKSAIADMTGLITALGTLISVLSIMPEDMFIRGVGRLTVIALLALGISAAMTLINNIGKTNGISNMSFLTSFVVLLGAMTGVIYLLSMLDHKQMWDSIGAVSVMSLVILGISALMAVIGKKMGTLKDVGKSLLALIPAILAIGAVVVAIKLLSDVDPSVIASFGLVLATLSIGLLAMVPAITALGVLPISIFAKGIGFVAIAAAAITAIVGGIMGLVQIPGVKSFAKNGAKSLGEIFGSFKAGFESAQLDAFADANSKLQGVEPIDSAKMDQAVANAKAISDFFTNVPDTTLWEGLLSRLNIGKSDVFAQNVSDFCTAMNDVATQLGPIEVLDPDQNGTSPLKTKVDNAVKIATAIQGIFSGIEPGTKFEFSASLLDGIVLKVRESSAETFANDINTFINSMATLSTTLMSDEYSNVSAFAADSGDERYSELSKKLTNAVGVAKILSGFFKDLPDISSDEIITKVNDKSSSLIADYSSVDMAAFAADLLTFVSAMAAFNNAIVADATSLDYDPESEVYTTITNAVSVAQKMAGFFKNDVPEVSEDDLGKWNTYFVNGDWVALRETLDMDTFYANMIGFVTLMSDFATEFANDNNLKINLSTEFDTFYDSISNALKIAVAVNEFINGVRDTQIGETVYAYFEENEDLKGAYTNMSAEMDVFVGDMMSFIIGTNALVDSFTAIGADNKTLSDKLIGDSYTAITTAMNNAVAIGNIMAAFMAGDYASLVFDDSKTGAFGTGITKSEADMQMFVTMIDKFVTSMSQLKLSSDTIKPIDDSVLEATESYAKLGTTISGLFTALEGALDGTPAEYYTGAITELTEFNKSLDTLVSNYGSVENVNNYMQALQNLVDTFYGSGATEGNDTDKKISVSLVLKLEDPRNTAIEWADLLKETINSELEEYHPTIKAVLEWEEPNTPTTNNNNSGGNKNKGKSENTTEQITNDITQNSSVANNYNTTNNYNISNSVYVTGNTLDINNDAWYQKVASKLVTYINRSNRSYGTPQTIP